MMTVETDDAGRESVVYIVPRSSSSAFGHTTTRVEYYCHPLAESLYSYRHT